MKVRNIRRQHNLRRQSGWVFSPWVRLRDFKLKLIHFETGGISSFRIIDNKEVAWAPN